MFPHFFIIYFPVSLEQTLRSQVEFKSELFIIKTQILIQYLWPSGSGAPPPSATALYLKNGGGGTKIPPTSFSPVTYTNVRITL